ncbi:MAG: serine hydrolase [bacterium]|nr:class C beta-lactamase-related serine hydrolase [Gammaproteobacteria bacterium]
MKVLLQNLGAVFALSIGLLPTVFAAPLIDPMDDAKHFAPPGASVLFWTPEQQVAGYRNYDKISPTRRIQAGDSILELPYALQDLGDVKLKSDGDPMTVGEYFQKQSVAGLLVIKQGKIVYERYGLGNTEASVWTSFSVAKSVVSLLVGAAVQDGYIASLDEKVTDYVPRMKGSPYDQSSIRNIMQMSSGVKWNEDYADPNSDISSNWSTGGNAGPASLATYVYLRRLPREAEPGEKFNYNTAETNLVGDVLRAAIGNNLATYLSHKIWQPYGMESDANWLLTEAAGGEFGGCCISATLRDYGRIGLFAMNNGRLKNGQQVLPETWMKDSTEPSKGFKGYGFMWWLQEEGAYSASGIFGQGIYIDPGAEVVIAIHSARPNASRPQDWKLQQALYEALVKALP